MFSWFRAAVVASSELSEPEDLLLAERFGVD
jgi:hypothetical protein